MSRSLLGLLHTILKGISLNTTKIARDGAIQAALQNTSRKIKLLQWQSAVFFLQCHFSSHSDLSFCSCWDATVCMAWLLGVRAGHMMWAFPAAVNSIAIGADGMRFGVPASSPLRRNLKEALAVWHIACLA